MPGRDGTGPAGMGPATGWGMGPCGGRGGPAAPGRGLGMGRGFAGGGGRGWRRLFYATGLTRWQRLAEAQNEAAEMAGAGGGLESMKRLAGVLERLLADAKAGVEALEGKKATAASEGTKDDR